jgi:hypothetical protein
VCPLFFVKLIAPKGGNERIKKAAGMGSDEDIRECKMMNPSVACGDISP